MITITRRLTFAAGHRVFGHESKCAHLHGHNYVAEIVAHADTLDALGRVVDFSVLKTRVGGWVDEMWDHGMILYRLDAPAIAAMEAFATAGGGAQKLFLLDTNPTAENMAAFLVRLADTLLRGTGVRVIAVRLHETENCLAEVVA